MKDKVIDYFDEFVIELREQLITDEKRWGNTWQHRTRAGQIERIRHTFNDYFDKELHGGHKVNWLAVVGNAMIAWIRERADWVEPIDKSKGENNG
jgi:hypothetical protein